MKLKITLPSGESKIFTGEFNPTILSGTGKVSGGSKVKTLVMVDVEAIESLNAFVDSVVTENRLEQGLDNLVREQLKPFEMESMGDFIRWVYSDVMKEETDTIIENGFDPKKLGGPIAKVARTWYIKKFNESI